MTSPIVHVFDGKTGFRFSCMLSKTPRRIQYREVIYYRVDDPDTGEFLGCYVRSQWDD
ncbi:hypothetical protein PP301_gp092 [Gordonia phage GMA2]|uniref:Uncharacterized protein n=1 Tax=Gordonia phage GMA2 TaxID=1647283 RepID=A0A0K0N721_9CAUD|nr:hypothetical protein PP301_gp092 [Gordonia phage GMA2]AKJ72630.1 hypothetical protein GMA2_92 [Gordonia phage GMA2]